MSQKQVKAVSNIIAVGGIVALGAYVLKVLGQKKEAEPTIPEVKIIEVMKEKLVYFQDKGDEFRENLEDITEKMDVAKENFETGVVDVTEKISGAVDTINELREMTGREPATDLMNRLDALKEKVDSIVIPVVETTKDAVSYIPQSLRGRYQIR